MKKKLFPFFLAGALLLSGSSLQASTVFEEIICRVNNDIITRSEYGEARNLLSRQLQSREKLSGDKFTEAMEEREKHLLRDMIEERLLVQKAVELGMTADTDVIKYLDRVRKENNLPTIEALDQAMRKQGINPVEFKRRIKDQSLREQVLGREVYYRIQVSTEEIRTYYDANQPEFDRPEQVRLQEILIASDGDDPAEVERRKERAEEVLEKARSGELFDELVREYSEGPTARQGGDLGFFRRGMLLKEIEDAVFSLRRGQVSDIMEGQGGFRIFKVTEKNTAGIQALDVVKDRIRDILIARKAGPALKEYMAKLRRQSYIRLKSGYVDSGAVGEADSSDEEQPPAETPDPEVLDAREKDD